MKKPASSTQKVLNVWAVILIVWSIYRAKMRLPEWFDEFIAKPAIFIGPVAFYIISIEKKDFFSSLWFNKKNLLADLTYALVVALAFLMIAFIPAYIKTQTLTANTSVIMVYFQQLFVYLPIALATAVSEEIVSRGFVLKRLYEESRNLLSASFTASALFFILHIPILFANLKLTGSLLILFMITDLILSLANSFIFLSRKSLLLPILIHAFYNLTLILAV